MVRCWIEGSSRTEVGSSSDDIVFAVGDAQQIWWIRNSIPDDHARHGGNHDGAQDGLVRKA